MPDVGISEYMRIRRYVMNLILRADGKAAQIPTIQELSEKFGVSRPTVSKAMKELTSEGYIIGKRGIGTFTNPAKRAMVAIGKKLPLVGIMISDGLNVHLDKYIGCALAEILKQVVFVPAIAHLVTVGSSDPEQAVKEILDEQLDALVVFGSNRFTPQLRATGLPVIVSDYQPRIPGSVYFDYEDWGYRCGKQLLKENRRNIVFLHDQIPWNVSFPGIRRAYQEAGVPLNENLFLKNFQNSLNELKNIINYGIKVDAVCDTLLVNNEVTELLMELDPRLAETCAIIHNAASEPQNNGFHEICYDIPFAAFAAEVADLLKLQLKNNDAGQDIRKVDLPMVIR